MATSQEYYSNSSNLGNYQSVSLMKVIDRVMLMSLEPDSFIKNVRRFNVKSHAYDGIFDLTTDISQNVKGLELEIGDDLMFQLPQNFVNWVRVSVVKNGKLYPLNINRKVNLAPTYLQDHDFKLLFDHEGNVIEADGHNAHATPFKRFVFDCNYEKYCCDNNSPYGTQPAHFELDTSKISAYGEFAIDKDRGIIYLSSDLNGENIVLEYISDGLDQDLIDNEEITIHKYLEQPLVNWIYWKLIFHKRSVDKTEKVMARKEYYASRSQAVRRLSDLRLEEVIQAIRSRGPWVKT
ncbi:hypothetical protein [Galbibacter sp. BG1]